MKKIVPIIITITVYCSLLTINCNAQSLCKKGTWMIGVNPVNYSFANNNTRAEYQNGKLEHKNGDTSTFSGIGFSLSMGVGYFIKDHICVGAGFGSNLNPNSTPTSFLLPNQLFVRYYLMRKIHNFSFAKQDNNRRYAFFAEGAVSGGYATYNFDNNGVQGKGTDYAYGGKIAIGFTYMFTKHLAFEIMGMYSNVTYSSYLLPVSAKQIFINKQSGFNALFGVQGYF